MGEPPAVGSSHHARHHPSPPGGGPRRPRRRRRARTPCRPWSPTCWARRDASRRSSARSGRCPRTSAGRGRPARQRRQARRRGGGRAAPRRPSGPRARRTSARPSGSMPPSPAPPGRRLLPPHQPDVPGGRGHLPRHGLRARRRSLGRGRVAQLRRAQRPARTIPARDLQDTFWMEDGNVLRTHTSPVQLRVMQRGELPDPRGLHRPRLPQRGDRRDARAHLPPGGGPAGRPRGQRGPHALRDADLPPGALRRGHRGAPEARVLPVRRARLRDGHALARRVAGARRLRARAPERAPGRRHRPRASTPASRSASASTAS